MKGPITCDKIHCVLFMCAVLCFQWSIQAKVKVQVTEAEVKALREMAQKCEKETGVPAAQLKKIIDWPYPGDEASKKFLHCVCFNHGYTDKDGHIILENLGALPTLDGAKQEYISNLEECNKITKENYLETIFAVGNCVHESCHYVV